MSIQLIFSPPVMIKTREAVGNSEKCSSMIPGKDLIDKNGIWCDSSGIYK